MSTTVLEKPCNSLNLMDEVEDYMSEIYELSHLQVNANFIDRGGNALVYKHFTHSDRVLKFTTCRATIALKQIQLTEELSSCFPLLHNLTQLNDSIWLIEEEYLPKSVVDEKWINFIRDELMMLERPSTDDIKTLLYSVEKLKCKKHVKSEINLALITLCELLKNNVDFTFDLCGFNFRMRNDQLIFLDPITTKN